MIRSGRNDNELEERIRCLRTEAVETDIFFLLMSMDEYILDMYFVYM